MKVGDKIRIRNIYGDNVDYIIEEFRFCLGVFVSKQHREAESFVPLCDLYEDGAYSETKYISNFGEYQTNQVPRWMDIPK